MLPLKIKLFTLLVALKATFCGCYQDKKSNTFEKNRVSFSIKRLKNAPLLIKESSGLAINKSDSTLITHADSGSKKLYFHNLENGLLMDTLTIDTSNKDWEDIAQDEQGTLYIGDFGNNQNKRNDLVIYKTSLSASNTISEIRFNYEDQEAFPPAQEERNFDCEALFHYNDSLYLFSKNRGNNCVKLYVLPATPGEHVAKVKDTQYMDGYITGADINADKTEFALLAYGKVYLYTINNNSIDFSLPYACLPFSKGGQVEGITYLNNQELLISNEAGRLFKLKIKR